MRDDSGELSFELDSQILSKKQPSQDCFFSKNLPNPHAHASKNPKINHKIQMDKYEKQLPSNLTAPAIFKKKPSDSGGFFVLKTLKNPSLPKNFSAHDTKRYLLNRMVNLNSR